MRSHRVSKLSMYDWTLVLLERFYCRCAERKLTQLVEVGQDRIDKEFDIVKIVKRLRNLKLILK